MFPRGLDNEESRKILMKESLLGRRGILHLDQTGGSTAGLSTSEGTDRGFHISKDLRSQHVVDLHTGDFFSDGLIEIAFKIREDGFRDTANHFDVDVGFLMRRSMWNEQFVINVLFGFVQESLVTPLKRPKSDVEDFPGSHDARKVGENCHQMYQHIGMQGM